MGYKTFVVSLTALFFFASPVSYAGTGRTAAQFLGLEKDARAAAMGKAFITMSGDVGCIFYNPGGLGSMEEAQATGAYTNLAAMFGEASEGMYTFSLAGGMPIDMGLLNRSLGVIAAGLLVQDQGDMMVTRDSPTPVGVVDLGKNWAMTLSYAKQLSGLATGLSFKLIHQQLWTEGDTAYAVDLGSQYDLLRFFFNRDLAQANDPSLGLRFGAAIQNWGTKMQMTDAYQGQPLPRELSFGASISSCLRLRDMLPNSSIPVGFAIIRFCLSGELTAFIDKLKESEEDRWNPNFDKKKAGVGIYAFRSSNMEKNIGAEMWFFDILAFRLGYINIPDMLEDHLVYGLGLRLPISHLIALLTSRASEPNLFDRLYRETDRQVFMEFDFARNQAIEAPGSRRTTTITFKVGI